MKKLFKISNILFLIIIISTAVFYGSSVFNDNKNENYSAVNENRIAIKSVRETIADRKLNDKFEKVKLFDFTNSNSKSYKLDKYVKSGSFLHLRTEDLKKFNTDKYQNLIFNIPVSEGKEIELELTKVDILKDDFTLKAVTENGAVTVNYNKGLYYRGIIKDKPNSLAAISIFENEIIGVISDENGNYNLGAVNREGNSNPQDYIYYNDKELLVKNTFDCKVDDYGKKLIKPVIQKNPANGIDALLGGRGTVGIYIEADYQFYLDKGANISTVSNYITE